MNIPTVKICGAPALGSQSHLGYDYVATAHASLLHPIDDAHYFVRDSATAGCTLVLRGAGTRWGGLVAEGKQGALRGTRNTFTSEEEEEG